MRLDKDEQSFQELINSIRANGVEQDLIVRTTETENIFEVIDGNRRYEATGNLGWGDAPLPCDIREMTDKEAWTLALRVNLLRAAPSPESLGNFIQMMRMKFGWTQHEVSRQIGKSQSWVSRQEKLFQDKSLPSGTGEAQARALRGAPEKVRTTILEESNSTGILPSATEIRKRAEARKAAVLEELDHSKHDEEYAAFLFRVQGGYMEEEAKGLASKWNRGELEKKTPLDTPPRMSDLNRKSSITRVFEQLTKYYPSEIVDTASKTSGGSTNLETLMRHCRRYISELNTQASEELKQRVLDQFMI
uniref:ParB-like N-terminal domain-containing protein n=1 Tax=viral metagenome TaxID=1070528 RepID=A0A6M3MFV1_9ZZZZ